MRLMVRASMSDVTAGAGLFFITYFIFEVPSNLALEKFGARRWIARIMLGDEVADDQERDQAPADAPDGAGFDVGRHGCLLPPGCSSSPTSSSRSPRTWRSRSSARAAGSPASC
jgi:hypothetical protein